jgi:quinol monooxygenase YgiN
MTVGIVAHLKVKEGSQADFETAFLELQAAVKKNEPGVIQYEVFKSKADPTMYVVMEQYKTEADLAAHRTMPHMAAAGPKLGAVLDGRPQIEILGKV